MQASNQLGLEVIWKRLQRIDRCPMILVFGLCVLGVLVDRVITTSIPWLQLAAGMAILVTLATRLVPSRRWIALLLVTLPLLAAWRHQRQEVILQQDRLHGLVSDEWQPVVVEAIVESTPQWRPDLVLFRDQPEQDELVDDDRWQTAFEMNVVAIRDGRSWTRGQFGRIHMTCQGRLRHLLPGDRVRVFQEWQRISAPTNPGQFNLAEKYRTQGILVRGRTDATAQVEFLGTDQMHRIDRWLAWIVVHADKVFHRYVGFGQATLASALVLGQRDQVEWAMQESLLATGTIHMLAISGMHIEMVAISILYLSLLIHLPKRWMLGITICVVIAYSMLCGGNPPVARAAIVVVVLCLARWTGKTTHAINLLALAGCVVMLYRPSYWLEIGTQLSFLAVMILILLSEDSRRRDSKNDALDALMTETHSLPRRVLTYFTGVVTNLWVTSYWVWWLTAPLVLYRFHVLSPIAIVLNLVLWIPMFLALLSGLGLLAFGWCGAWVAAPLGWFCGLNLAFTNWVVMYAEQIPLGHVWMTSPSLGWTLTFYLALLVTLALLGFRAGVRRGVFIASHAWMLFVAIPFLAERFDWKQSHRARSEIAQLEVSFIDVGHGTSVLMRTPSGKVWLYDAGRLGNSQRSYQSIADVFWHEKIADIDGVFLSHADSDHFNALPGLAKRFKLDHVYTTHHVIDSSSPSMQSALTRLREARVPITVCTSGDTMSDGDVRFFIAHPDEHGVRGTANANSLCLWIEYAGIRLLLPGDLEKEGVRQLISQPTKRAHLLMAPHHGSLAESPMPLLNWCNPDVVIVSGGNRARHPRVKPAWGSPDRQVYATASEHAIRCSISTTGQVNVESWSHPSWAHLASQ